MTQKAPGKHYRTGMSLMQLFGMFPDNETAMQWFVEARWPDGIRCAYCESENVHTNSAHKTMPYRCNDCKKKFSPKSNSLMHGSNISYQKWVIAIYLVTTNLKGVSSMKLRRDLNITQKAAWHMLHRIREFYFRTNEPFASEVEADESGFGGKRANMHHSKRKHLTGRGMEGKTIVAGLKDRETNQIRARVVPSQKKEVLQPFVLENTTEDARLYTDEAAWYRDIGRDHVAVNHSVSNFVEGQAHTNGMESFWSLMKRGFHGTYHHMSPKHLDRYVCEFEGRHNDRPSDTIDQMAHMVQGMVNKRLPYSELIAGEPAYPPLPK
ncbi:MAG: IS1595 family transposase [Caldilineaceae bacterium]|nr:IS1595 family transposase [Caldilineaceae bacterium]